MFFSSLSKMIQGVEVFILFSCVITISVTNAAPANVSNVNELLQAERTERLRLQDEVNTLADKLSEIDNRMQRDADWMSSKTKYSFTATRSGSVSIYSGQTLVFDKVLNNVGNIYNNIFGHFTVPMNGTYLIGVTILAQASNHVHPYLKKDTQTIHTFHFGDSSNGYPEADTVILTLKLIKGDVLYVQGGYNPDNIYGGSSFSGVLLYT